MELLKGTIYDIDLSAPKGTTEVRVTIKDLNNDSVVLFDRTVTKDSDSHSVTLTTEFGLVAEERGRLQITKTFDIDGNEFETHDYAKVVTPYIELHKVMEVLGTDDVSKCLEMESVVRFVINAHCGKEFGRTKEDQVVTGNGDSLIGLSMPIINLSSIQIDGNEEIYAISKGDYYASGTEYLKAPKGFNFNGTYSQYGIPILPPSLGNFSNAKFADDTNYRLKGEFGFESVPAEIRQAALMLAADYSCNDAMYRDRYLKSVRASDWRIEFASGAWSGTGSAKVDSLLSRYVSTAIGLV